MLFEAVQSRRPLGPVGLEPRVEFHEWFGGQSIHAALGIAANIDQSRFAQDFQVARNAGLMHTDLIDEFVDRAFARSNRIEYPPSRRFCDHIEHREVGGHSVESTSECIYAQAYLLTIVDPFGMFGFPLLQSRNSWKLAGRVLEAYDEECRQQVAVDEDDGDCEQAAEGVIACRSSDTDQCTRARHRARTGGSCRLADNGSWLVSGTERKMNAVLLCPPDDIEGTKAA